MKYEQDECSCGKKSELRKLGKNMFATIINATDIL